MPIILSGGGLSGTGGSTYSGTQIRTALARKAFAGQYPIDIDTTSVGTTTTVVISDLAFGSSGATTTKYHDVWIYIASLEGGGPSIGEISKALTTGGFTVASGTITVAPAFSLAVQTSTDLIFHYDLHPDDLWNAIQLTLRNLRFHSYLPVTLVTDGDMEDSGVTNWASIGSPTTNAKAATVFQFGRQALHLVSDATDEGATSNSVPVGQDDENLTLAVPIRLLSGSVDVILYDATNSTALKTVAVSDLETVMVYFQQAPGSTTKNVTVRTESSTAASEWYVGPVSLLSDRRSRYSLDTSSVARASDVQELYTLPLGQQVETDVYLMGEPFEPITRQVERDDRSNFINVVLDSNAPVFMKAWQRWPELASDADVTYADRDTIVQGAMYYLEMQRAAKHYADNPALASKHEQRAKTYKADYDRMTGIVPVEFEESLPNRTMVRFL